MMTIDAGPRDVYESERIAMPISDCLGADQGLGSKASAGSRGRQMEARMTRFVYGINRRLGDRGLRWLQCTLVGWTVRCEQDQG